MTQVRYSPKYAFDETHFDDEDRNPDVVKRRTEKNVVRRRIGNYNCTANYLFFFFCFLLIARRMRLDRNSSSVPPFFLSTSKWREIVFTIVLYRGDLPLLCFFRPTILLDGLLRQWGSIVLALVTIKCFECMNILTVSIDFNLPHVRLW